MRSALALLLSVVVCASAQAQCDAVTFTRVDHPISTGSPYVGSVIDVNRDGRDDAGIFFNETDRFNVYLSDENGTLTAPVAGYPTSSISALHLADVIGDGRPDALAGSSFDLRLYVGDGNGNFEFRRTVPLGAAPTGIRVADFDENGLRDIAVLTGITGQIRILLQTGAGTFTNGVLLTPGLQAADPEVADFDGDGNVDIAVANATLVTIYYGNGNGTFSAATHYALPPDEFGTSGTIEIIDLNGDARVDLAAGWIGSGVHLLVNDGARAFHVAGNIAPASGAYDVKVTDLNADGIDDLVITDYGGFTTVLGNGDATFEAPVFHAIPEHGTGSSARAAFLFETGDVRGDRRADLVGRVATTFFEGFIVTFLNDCVPSPVLTSITPSAGRETGGETVTIRGESLLTATSVMFGSTAGEILERDGNVLTVRVPAVEPSIVDVTVTTDGGTDTLEDAYTFVGASTITLTFDPATPTTGGELRLIATVAPAGDGGTVTFSGNGIVFGTVPVISGVAELEITPARAGPLVVTAAFSGSAILDPGSDTATVNVAPAALGTAQVPTLSEYAAIALLLILGGVALLRLA